MLDGLEDFLKRINKDCTQARAVELDAALSPDERERFRVYLSDTIQGLVKIQEGLEELDAPWFDECIVQIIGLIAEKMSPTNFMDAYAGWCREYKGAFPRIKNVQINVELNTLPGPDKWLQSSTQVFAVFDTNTEAEFVLSTVKEFKSVFPGNSLKFQRPAFTSAEREEYRKIAKNIARVQEIEKELKSIGVRKGHDGVLELDPKYVDNAVYEEKLRVMKRARSSGLSIDREGYHYLALHEPADLQKLQKRVADLYDAQCDARIFVRERQLRGMAFRF
jgi:hypothetical protein